MEPPLTAAERKDIIARGRRFEADRYVDNRRIVPVSGYLVAFAPGETPVIELDVWDAGPHMERAACMIGWHGDKSIERIAARHRELRDHIKRCTEA